MFDGIVRPDGRVGTRNYVAVLSSVNCSATVVKRIAAGFAVPGALDDHPGVDGVIAVTHGSGCGLSRDGEGLEVLRRTLAGYARHPNVAAVVVVGLGCEVNQINALIDGFDLPEGVPLRRLVIQELGGSVATVRRGMELVTELLPAAARAAPTGAGERADARPQLRRLGRMVGGHRQPGARRRRRPPRRRRRHRHPRRDPGDPRRRASAHQPRRVARGGTRADGADRVVGGATPRPRAATWTTTPPRATAPAG